ncbi:hypothetical protein EL22_27390 [Halostagnicola sp. A56]|nr:hypothetical protein EL22_27390 [Halostagnicola sp. A56]
MESNSPTISDFLETTVDSFQLEETCCFVSDLEPSEEGKSKHTGYHCREIPPEQETRHDSVSDGGDGRQSGEPRRRNSTERKSSQQDSETKRRRRRMVVEHAGHS